MDGLAVRWWVGLQCGWVGLQCGWVGCGVSEEEMDSGRGVVGSAGGGGMKFCVIVLGVIT